MKTIFRIVETHMGDGTIHFIPQKIHPEKGDETILDGLIWKSMWAHPLSTFEEAKRVIEIHIERHERKNRVVQTINHPYPREWDGRI